MKEKDLISSVRFTARGVTRRWISAYKQVKGISPNHQLNEMSVHMFIIWALSTQGCPGNLRAALQTIMNAWQDEASIVAHDAGISDLMADRKRAGLD